MITLLLLYALAIGSLLALGALVLDRAAQWARIPQRFIWFGALFLLVGLTLVAPLRMASTPAPAATDLDLPATSFIPDPAGFTAEGLSALPSLQQTLGSLAGRVPASVDRALGLAWACTTVLLLGLLLLLLHRLDQQRRRWPRALLLGTPVRLSDREGPAVYGVFTPEIVVPRRFLACDREAQALVLAHEEAHRQAQDPLVLALAAALVMVVPWHPAAWWFLSRLRLASEVDCDSRVLGQGMNPRHYGEALLSLASTFHPAPRAVHGIALFSSPRNLHRRLLAMTTPTTRRSPLFTGGVGLAGAALLFAACSTDVPTATEVRDADVAAVTEALGLPTTPGAMEFVVDGEVRTEAEARALAAGEIATIDIRRGGGQNGADQIRITRVGGEPRPDTLPVVQLRGLPIGDSANAPQPLVVVDGVIATGSDVLRSLRPEQIATIEIVKGEAALGLYGERGANGVIRITTKP
jgi:TonB-dependent SusC/RagA subfamily outer membrane receptor